VSQGNCRRGLCSKLLTKSIDAYVLSLETINRISVANRIEAFTYLICNSWELLLKAHIIEMSGNRDSIYYRRKKGQLRRTLSLHDCLENIYPNERDPIRRNVERIKSLRDDAVHLVIGPLPANVMSLLQACVLNYHNELGNWFDVSLSDRVPVGMMTIVYDVSFEHFAHGIPALRKKMDKETFLYLANLGTEIAAEQDELGNPIEFSATVDYRFSVTKKASEADISLTQGADGSPLRFVEVAKDPSRTHPLLQKDVISKLRAAVGEGSKINQHDIRCIVAVYKIPNRPDFYYRSSLQGSPQYSEGFIDWILQKYKQDPAFFATTRLKAKPILEGPMLNRHRQGKATPG
jgi:hypothetical protein